MCYDDLNAADNLAAGGALANKCLQFQFLLIILLLTQETSARSHPGARRLSGPFQAI